MFISTTWSEFFVVIGVMAFIYFVILGYTYYKKDITHFLLSMNNHQQETPEAPMKKSDLMPIVHELVSDLGLVIRKASDNTPALPELLFALKSRIKDFVLLESTEYRGMINLYINQELEIHGIQGIGLEEIENLWKP